MDPLGPDTMTKGGVEVLRTWLIDRHQQLRALLQDEPGLDSTSRQPWRLKVVLTQQEIANVQELLHALEEVREYVDELLADPAMREELRLDH